MMKRTTFLLVLTFISLFSHAKTCTQLHNATFSSFRTNYFFTGDLQGNEQLIKRIEKLFSSINEDLLEGLELPKEITIEIRKNNSTAYYLEESNTLYLPSELDPSEGLTDFEDLLTIYAHEYGHVIFELNLKNKSKEYRRNLEIMKTAKKASQENLDLGNYFNEIDRIANLDTMFISSYHELFADIVAVLIRGDLDAMRKSLDDQSGKDYGKSRSFTMFQKINSWEAEEPHALFFPVRGFLGLNYMQSTSDLRNTNFLEKVMNTMKAEIDKKRSVIKSHYDKNPTLEIHEYPVEPIEMNKSLIKALKNKLENS